MNSAANDECGTGRSMRKVKPSERVARRGSQAETLGLRRT